MKPSVVVMAYDLFLHVFNLNVFFQHFVVHYCDIYSQDWVYKSLSFCNYNSENSKKYPFLKKWILDKFIRVISRINLPWFHACSSKVFLLLFCTILACICETWSGISLWVFSEIRIRSDKNVLINKFWVLIEILIFLKLIKKLNYKIPSFVKYELLFQTGSPNLPSLFY